MSEPGDSPEGAQVVDATRRTRLAAERTLLAWWRTGLTALAVALGVGRVVPALNDSTHRWPYELLGFAFAVYGVALVVFGSARGREVDEALAAGQYAKLTEGPTVFLASAGVVLGIATAILIVVG